MLRLFSYWTSSSVDHAKTFPKGKSTTKTAISNSLYLKHSCCRNLFQLVERNHFPIFKQKWLSFLLHMFYFPSNPLFFWCWIFLIQLIVKHFCWNQKILRKHFGSNLKKITILRLSENYRILIKTFTYYHIIIKFTYYIYISFTYYQETSGRLLFIFFLDCNVSNKNLPFCFFVSSKNWTYCTEFQKSGIWNLSNHASFSKHRREVFHKEVVLYPYDVMIYRYIALLRPQ